MSKQISDERKAAYYLGAVIMGIGFLLFLSTFVTVFLSIQQPMVSTDDGGVGASIGFRALGGIILLIIGGAIRGIGARGVAGSGVILDPEQAREDLEPYSRMAGGMVKDAADEAGVDLGKINDHEDKQISSQMPFDEKLRRLAKLHEEGILSDEEYAREKQKILDEQ